MLFVHFKNRIFGRLAEAKTGCRSQCIGPHPGSDCWQSNSFIHSFIYFRCFTLLPEIGDRDLKKRYCRIGVGGYLAGRVGHGGETIAWLSSLTTLSRPVWLARVRAEWRRSLVINKSSIAYSPDRAPKEDAEQRVGYLNWPLNKSFQECTCADRPCHRLLHLPSKSGYFAATTSSG